MKRWLSLLLVLLVLPFGSVRAADVPDAPIFSLPSGFYDAPITLTIDAPAGTTVHYTTDGTLPTAESALYESPLTLGWLADKHDPLSHITGVRLGDAFVPVEDFPSGHVIRAAAFAADGTHSAVVSATYFVGSKREALYGDTAVMFLVMDPADLFDYERGIYITGKVFDDWVATQPEDYPVWRGQGNYTQRGDAWERPVSVTLLTADGRGFTQEMGVRIKGSSSRNSNQKSLRLIARKRYGAKNVAFPIFPGNLAADGTQVSLYKSFTLRNGSNDNGFATIRDPYLQQLVAGDGLRFETAATRPVVCFINGEYWGLYTLTEEYTDQYIEYHYGLDHDNVVTVKCQSIEDGQPEDVELFRSAFDFIMNGDMADPALYAQAETLMDMGSFADYTAYQLYILNLDSHLQNSNWQVWRVREPDGSSPYADGRWRWMVYDVDNAAGLYTDGASYDVDNLTPVLIGEGYQWRHPAKVLISLLDSDAFRQEFARALCDVRNLYFRPDRTEETLRRMNAQYNPYLPDTFRRFGPEWALWDIHEYITEEIEKIHDFLTGRYNHFLPLMQQALRLPDPVNVQVYVQGAGQVVINHRTDVPLAGDALLTYFPGGAIAVTAIPAEGSTFAGWQVNGGTLADPDAPDTTLAFDGAVTLTAIFE